MPAFNQSRQNFIRILFLLAFIVLVLRLLFLQLGSKKYDLLALDNAVSKKIIYPDRGIIFDRKGKSILENTLTYDLMINPTQLKGMDTLGLCKILNISLEDFKDRVVGAIVKNGRYRPSVFEGSLAIETSFNCKKIFFALNQASSYKSALFVLIRLKQQLIF